MMLLALAPPAATGAGSHVQGKTIKDLSDAIPLGLLERSVGQKFYQSLLRSPLDDWTIIRAQITGTRLSAARAIRRSQNPAYNALALKVANELTLVANDPSRTSRAADSALVHLLVYRIADGVMAVSFAYREAGPGQQPPNIGTVRLSVKTREGPWTEIRPRETLHDSKGRRLQRSDRMPMDVISVPRP